MLKKLALAGIFALTSVVSFSGGAVKAQGTETAAVGTHAIKAATVVRGFCPGSSNCR